MPRPKKEGAPEPKKRSRNGCWPCKKRKVKCSEIRPTCAECDRSGDTCDYSIRLNWDGRGKKKGKEGEGADHFVTTPASFISGIEDETGASSSTSAFEGVAVEPSSSRSISGVLPSERHVPSVGSSEELRSQRRYSILAPLAFPRHDDDPRRPSMVDPLLLPGRQSMIISQSSLVQPHEYHSPEASDRDASQRFPYERKPSWHVQRLNLNSPSDSSPVSPSKGMFTGTVSYSQATPTSSPYLHEKRFEEENVAPMSISAPRFKRPRYGSRDDEHLRSTNAHTMPPPGGNSAMVFASSLPHHIESADPRRLSVESLLSGPPGMGSDYSSSQARGSFSRGSFSDISRQGSIATTAELHEEMITLGMDRGFKDLDVGKNQDLNAISGGSPIASRDILESADAEDYVSTEFGFGVQAKDTLFEGGHYYARPVTIKIPRSFEPLPLLLNQNPMNLLYFHHFISHTARILVPHHCSSNPFQTLLPRMALRDPNLMSLLLAYSAAHRARLLQHPEPAMRIALWVQDIFPNLRFALTDPSRMISNTTLATAIMLASLEIISPKAFGVAVPWKQHLDVARQVILARGGTHNMYRDRSNVSRFLLKWFAYLDVLGSLVGGSTDLPLWNGSVWAFEEDDSHDQYQIDCLLGFTTSCITVLARVADLARFCDKQRIGPDHCIRPDWELSTEISDRAHRLISDTEDSLVNTRVQPCPHLHSAGESADPWDNRQMAAVNEAYHWAGLIHIHRRILGKPSNHPDVQGAVREVISALYAVRKGSTAEACLLFPMFTAGCDVQNEKQKALILDRLIGVEEFGMSQVKKARTLMQRVWQTGKPWETLVAGEFVG